MPNRITMTVEVGRTIRGIINTTGPSIIAGSGFTVTKNGVGDVTVHFTPPFVRPPAVAGEAIGSMLTGFRFLGVRARPSVTSVRLLRVTSTAAEDGELDFIAMET